MAPQPAACPKVWHGGGWQPLLGRLAVNPCCLSPPLPMRFYSVLFSIMRFETSLTLQTRPSNQSISPVQTNPSCIAPRAAPHAAFAALAAAHSNRLSAPTRAIVPV